jgi:EndoU nuclease-like protein
MKRSLPVDLGLCGAAIAVLLLLHRSTMGQEPVPEPATQTFQLSASVERDVDDLLGAYWHVFADERNAIQAYQVAFGDQFTIGIERRPAIEARIPAGLVVFIGLGPGCWDPLISAKSLILQSANTFEAARRVPEPREEELVREANQLMRQAATLIQSVASCFFDARSKWIQVREESRRRGGVVVLPVILPPQPPAMPSVAPPPTRTRTPTPSPSPTPTPTCNINQEHIFEGEISPKTGAAVGFHHRFRGIDPRDGRTLVAEVIRILQQGPDGTYKAQVRLRDPATGNWVVKQDPSTFFPDQWTKKQVIDEICCAWRNATRLSDTVWVGRCGNGPEIKFFTDPYGLDIISAFPDF